MEPPPEDASQFELQLREALTQSVSSYPGISSSMMNTFMNASTPVIHSYCKMFSNSLEVSDIEVFYPIKFRFKLDFI